VRDSSESLGKVNEEELKSVQRAQSITRVHLFSSSLRLTSLPARHPGLESRKTHPRRTDLSLLSLDDRIPLYEIDHRVLPDDLYELRGEGSSVPDELRRNVDVLGSREGIVLSESGGERIGFVGGLDEGEMGGEESEVGGGFEDDDWEKEGVGEGVSSGKRGGE